MIHVPSMRSNLTRPRFQMVFSRGPDRVHLEAAKDLLVDPTDEDCFQPLVNLIVTGMILQTTKLDNVFSLNSAQMINK